MQSQAPRSGVSAPVPCPICGSPELVEFSGRPHARCNVCNSLERHRKLAHSQAALLEHGEGRRVLEVGPLNPRVFGDYLRARGWRYTSIDQSARGNPVDPRDTSFVDGELDLCHLEGFADASVQLVLAQHVIEEIVDFQQAFAEIARVLCAHGTALLEIPFDPAQPRSHSQPPAAFGNVWRFGAELPEQAREHFGEVDVLSYREGRHRGHLFICRP
ncbi:MAG TPA: methyltransferase domain-containing protein [Solirubrobacteraceae bacterium]